MTIELMEKIAAALPQNSNILAELVDEMNIEKLALEVAYKQENCQKLLNDVVDILSKSRRFMSVWNIKAASSYRYINPNLMSRLADIDSRIVKRKINGRNYYCLHPSLW